MEKAPEKRKVLGKGLAALLPSRTPPAAASLETATRLPLELIDPNPVQPRVLFDQARIDELAASIQANGIIQPLIVRRRGERYELVAGERRLRASKEAGLTEVPVVVQDYADEKMLEVALIENIQREDLNPIETAQALERLGRELGISHEEIGRRTGKDRATVSNLLRLLKLPQGVQVLVAEHRISMGHARAILGIIHPDEQLDLAEKAARTGLSVRQVESIAQARAGRSSRAPAPASAPGPADPNVLAAVRELESVLSTKVRIVERDARRGKIEIDYYSPDELTRIYELLMNGAGGRS